MCHKIHFCTSFPSGKFVREGVAQGHIIITTGRMTIYCNTKKPCPEKITISRLTGTFLGVLNINTFYTFWVLDRRAHDHDLVYRYRENTHSQNTTFFFRPFVGYVWIILRGGPTFELQLLGDRQ